MNTNSFCLFDMETVSSEFR